MWLLDMSLPIRISQVVQNRHWRYWAQNPNPLGERLRIQARLCSGPRHHLSGVTTISVHMCNHSLTGCLFLFNLQEEAARILAHQPMSVGTCAALKTPTLQWMCKRSCMEKRVVCPLLSLSWVFPLSNMKQMWCMPSRMRNHLRAMVCTTILI